MVYYVGPYNSEDVQNELYHHGTKGMRWGVRRYQNQDGSLTPLGQKRRSLGEYLHDRKVSKKRKETLEKARATKAAKKAEEEKVKAEAEKRQKLLEKGKIPAKKMTNEELAAALTRKNAEKQYQEAVLATDTSKRFMKKLVDDALIPGVTNAGKNIVDKFLTNTLTDALGLKEQKSAYQKAKEEAEMIKWKKENKENKKRMEELDDDELNTARRDQELSKARKETALNKRQQKNQERGLEEDDREEAKRVSDEKAAKKAERDAKKQAKADAKRESDMKDYEDYQKNLQKEQDNLHNAKNTTYRNTHQKDTYETIHSKPSKSSVDNGMKLLETAMSQISNSNTTALSTQVYNGEAYLREVVSGREILTVPYRELND